MTENQMRGLPWRHAETGTVYRVLNVGKHRKRAFVTFENVVTWRLDSLPLRHFLDGRFEQLNPLTGAYEAPAPGQKKEATA